MRGSAIVLATWSWLEMQELEYALRQAGGLERFCVALGHQRRLRGHLQDHAVARQQRRNYRVHRGEPRVIPRRDYQHHAQRLAADEALETVFLWNREIGQRLFGDAAHVKSALLEAAAQLAGGLRHRPAHLPAQFRGELVCFADAPVGHAAADGGALGYGNLLPGLLSFAGAAERFLDRLPGGELAGEVSRTVNRRDGALNGFHCRDSKSTFASWLQFCLRLKTA